MNTLPSRLASIDVFRAITMLLMIFVNDFWTLTQVPHWLEHTAAQEDGMGLSDFVFPVFLFIVGLSLPFALRNRISRGHTLYQNLSYIVLRSVALLIMGFFHVNMENFGADTPLSRPVFQILATVAFFLIWLDYKQDNRRFLQIFLQLLGITVLCGLAFIYRAADGGWMQPHWWGILGLIGWSYLLCSLYFLFTKGKLSWAIGGWLFFILFNMGAQSSLFSFLEPVKQYVWIVGDGAMPALVMAGVITGLMYRYYWDKQGSSHYLSFLVIAGMAVLLVGFLLRYHWILSKILATPPWVAVSTGTALLVFALLVWLVDLRGKKDWFEIIRPAGTSSLTCYLLPYVHYAVYALLGYALSLYMRTGGIGLVKSFLYSLSIIIVVGFMEKIRLRLRV